MLGCAGLATTVLDRAERPAVSWRRRYDGLRLNTVRWLSSLPRYPMERRYGDWPTRDEWADYLERYATRARLELELGVTVERVDRADAGYRVETSRGALAAPVVVVATGIDRVATLPDWPGADGFTAELLHSSQFRNAAPFRPRTRARGSASQPPRASPPAARSSVRTGGDVAVRSSSVPGGGRGGRSIY